MTFDFNTATPDEIRVEAARREAKKNGTTPPDPIQEKRRETLLEKEVQQRVIACYKKAGCAVYNYSQPRKAMYVSPGSPDLLVISPMMATGWNSTFRARIVWYHETKRLKGGVYSDDQLKFAALCREAGIAVIGGGTDEAQKQLDRLNIKARE